MVLPRLGALTALVAACGGAPSPAPPSPAPTAAEAAVPELVASTARLHPGEGATYLMSLASVEIGEAAFAVGEPGELDGRPAIKVTSRATGKGLVAMLGELGADGETTIDETSGLPILAEGLLRWGDERYRGRLAYDGPAVDGNWYDEDDQVVEGVYRYSDVGPLHNVHTAMAAVRAWDGVPGERRRLELHGAVNVWHVTLTWIGDDTIGGVRGNQAAVRLEGECLLDYESSWTVRIGVWLSADDQRVPLRMTAKVKFLEATFTLTDYRPPGSDGSDD